MKVRCSLCGAEQEITKIHKDYQRLAREPEAVYICNYCSRRVQYQAKETQKPQRPI
ncbi:MAG: DUF2197 domain-containing protein [Clostridia bacterium]|jgi:uncharacterized protein YlaI|nr:DUF2197 domain-containing protein [Clostridia bacterium]